jgi:hypothetical protein
LRWNSEITQTAEICEKHVQRKKQRYVKRENTYKTKPVVMEETERHGGEKMRLWFDTEMSIGEQVSENAIGIAWVLVHGGVRRRRREQRRKAGEQFGCGSTEDNSRRRQLTSRREKKHAAADL